MEPNEDEELKKIRVRVSLPFIYLLSMLEAMLKHSLSKSWMISGTLVMSGDGECE